MKAQVWWWSWRVLMGLAIAYGLACGWLWAYQRQLIFHPKQALLRSPADPDFKLPYQDITIPVPDSAHQLKGWWIPAPGAQEAIATLPHEPVRVLKSPKTVLFFCGAGGNRSYFLARIEGLRQLGFAVMVVDYRGYGQSQGEFPSETQLYEDSNLAWNYLTQVRQVPPHQIVLYGESLGGAIAIHLASQHPQIAGVIIQSSFTSIAAIAKQRPLLGLFPIDGLLTQRFDSLSKVSQVRSPILFIHGTADRTVPVAMSHQLYQAASQPKQLHLIPGAEHVQIYRPGQDSYLKAMQQFVDQHLSAQVN